MHSSRECCAAACVHTHCHLFVIPLRSGVADALGLIAVSAWAVTSQFWELFWVKLWRSNNQLCLVFLESVLHPACLLDLPEACCQDFALLPPAWLASVRPALCATYLDSFKPQASHISHISSFLSPPPRCHLASTNKCDKFTPPLSKSIDQLSWQFCFWTHLHLNILSETNYHFPLSRFWSFLFSFWNYHYKYFTLLFWCFSVRWNKPHCT